MYEHFAFMYMCVLHVCLVEARKGAKSLESSITDGCEPPRWILGIKPVFSMAAISGELFLHPSPVNFNLLSFVSFSACMVIPTYLYASSSPMPSVSHNYPSAFDLLSSFLAFSSQLRLPLTSLLKREVLSFIRLSPGFVITSSASLISL